MQREDCKVDVGLAVPSEEVALDGEVVRLEPPLHFASLPGAITVLVPAPGASAD